MTKKRTTDKQSDRRENKLMPKSAANINARHKAWKLKRAAEKAAKALEKKPIIEVGWEGEE